MKPKVLIVDDEADLRESVGYLLASEGFEVLFAANGHEGIGAVISSAPDLVLLDVMMPRENGYRVARHLRLAQAYGLVDERMRIVLLTARKLDHDPERERMFEQFARPDGVIYKPFDPERLVATVRQMTAWATAPTPAPQAVPA